MPDVKIIYNFIIEFILQFLVLLIEDVLKIKGKRAGMSFKVIVKHLFLLILSYIGFRFFHMWTDKEWNEVIHGPEWNKK